MKPSKEEREALKVLTKLGYEVRLQKPTTKKTFEVEIETLTEFMRVVERLDLKVKEAIQDALSAWIEKNR
jgi:hypothetical protein